MSDNKNGKKWLSNKRVTTFIMLAEQKCAAYALYVDTDLYVGNTLQNETAMGECCTN